MTLQNSVTVTLWLLLEEKSDVSIDMQRTSPASKQLFRPAAEH
jgi:hypothetical protein